jgi:hypothetical protein
MAWANAPESSLPATYRLPWPIFSGNGGRARSIRPLHLSDAYAVLGDVLLIPGVPIEIPLTYYTHLIGTFKPTPLSTFLRKEFLQDIRRLRRGAQAEELTKRR